MLLSPGLVDDRCSRHYYSFVVRATIGNSGDDLATAAAAVKIGCLLLHCQVSMPTCSTQGPHKTVGLVLALNEEKKKHEKDSLT